MSGADIIPPVLPAPAHEDLFLEWQSPEAEAGYRQLCRLRDATVEAIVAGMAPRVWERLSRMDEGNRARAMAVAIGQQCAGIDREIAAYLAAYSHPAMLVPEGRLNMAEADELAIVDLDQLEAAADFFDELMANGGANAGMGRMLRELK